MIWMDIAIFGLGILAAVALGCFFYFLKSSKKLAYIIGGVFILFSVSSFSLFYFKSTRCQIILSPKEIASSKNFITKEQFKIKNIGDEFVYQLWVKFKSSIKNFDYKRFQTELVDEPEADLPLGDKKVSSFVYKIGATDKNGNEVIYIVLDCVEPNNGYTFNITLDNQGNNSAIKIWPELLGFSFEPNIKGVTEKGWAIWSMTPPEDFTLNSISVLIRKK